MTSETHHIIKKLCISHINLNFNHHQIQFLTHKADHMLIKLDKEKTIVSDARNTAPHRNYAFHDIKLNFQHKSQMQFITHKSGCILTVLKQEKKLLRSQDK